MNKHLYLQHSAKKYMNLVESENDKQKNLELSTDQIQELVENETQKLIELLNLYEKNMHDKSLEIEFKTKKSNENQNTIINTMNEIIKENLTNLETIKTNVVSDVVSEVVSELVSEVVSDVVTDVVNNVFNEQSQKIITEKKNKKKKVKFIK